MVTLQKLLIICGPTASGKSELALRLAHSLNAEIVNADSMQVYSRLDIGTAKPSAQQQAEVRHHLLNVVEPDQHFSAADFADAADAAICDIVSRDKRVIVVGGTGLYIRALIKGLVDSPGSDAELRRHLQNEADRIGNIAMLERLRHVDPDLAAAMHPNNQVRIIRALEVYQLTGIPLSRHQQDHAFATRRYDTLQLGITVERALLYQRIEQRVDHMLAEGLLNEVEHLLAEGYGRNLKSLGAIGYKEMSTHVAGELSFDEAVSLIKRNTRHYAKRQLTWFNADPDILWFEYPEKFDIMNQLAIDFFQRGEA
jgi:tRNA dimethylallyltransferase